MTPRLKDTLRYSFKLFCFVFPLYYVVYRLFWDDVPHQEMLLTALMYAGINVLFLGPLHYFRTRPADESE